METTVRTRIVLPAASAEVWRVWSDLARWQRWTRTINAGEPVPADPWTVGSNLSLIARLTIPMKFAATVIEAKPGELVVWEGRSGGVTGRHRFHFRPLGDETEFLHDEHFSGAGVWLLRLIGALGATQRLFETYNADLARQLREPQGLRQSGDAGPPP